MIDALKDDIAGAVVTGVLILATAMIDVSDPIVITIGGGILAGLTGTVKVLWDRNNKLTEKTELALAHCQAEHQQSKDRYEADRNQLISQMNELVSKVIALSSEVGVLKGRIEGYQERAREDAKADHG